MSLFLNLFRRLGVVSPPSGMEQQGTVSLRQEIPSLPREIVACICDYACGTAVNEELCKLLFSSREITVVPAEKETCIAFQIIQRTQVAVVNVLPNAKRSAQVTENIPRLQVLIITEPIQLPHHNSLKQFQQIRYLRARPFDLEAQGFKELLRLFSVIERIELIDSENTSNDEYLEGVDASSDAFRWLQYMLPILNRLFQDVPSLIYVRWNNQVAFPLRQIASLPETLQKLASQLPVHTNEQKVQSIQIPTEKRYIPLEFN